MARKKKTKKKIAVEAYKHESAKRKNIPTAKMAGEGRIPLVEKAKYSYSPHLSPELRFDSSGRSDRVTEIVEKIADGASLSSEEVEILRGVAANASEPWLEWSGKKEEHDRGVLEVEPVALHIHERVSANAVIRAAKREDIQADLFADPKQEYKEAIQFYQHDVDWANRLILGDSLEVMSSLALRENMAGKVRMIYVDPPYGIKFSSNFQPEVGKRDVSEVDKDLSREVEVVKAYRDTWSLGVHSYLSYIRDRLKIAADLLSDDGTIFVQINYEHIHKVRQVLDEVFGPRNCISTIAYKKGAAQAKIIKNSFNYLLWYAKDINRAENKIHKVFRPRRLSDGTTDDPKKLALWLQSENGFERPLTTDEKRSLVPLPDGARVFRANSVRNRGNNEDRIFELEFQGDRISPGRGFIWRGDHDDMRRLRDAGRLLKTSSTLAYKYFLDESGGIEYTNLWDDTAGKIPDMVYAVQTHDKIIARCMTIATDPGDLILDPTCGGGTSALVAERLGRRWISIDTSRVSIETARQRILTAKFDRYKIFGESGLSAQDGTKARSVDPRHGFEYETFFGVTRTTVAKNENLDPILAKWKGILEKGLERINMLVPAAKSSTKGRRSHRESTSDVDAKGTIEQIPSGFDHWTVPFECPDHWPSDLRDAIEKYGQARIAKANEVSACIKGNAITQDLRDLPKVVQGVLRVSGPFTIEGVRPEELSFHGNGELIDPTPNEWDVSDGLGVYAQNATAYIDRMSQLIAQDGVTFLNNENRGLQQLERLENATSTLHAEARWKGSDETEAPNIGIAFGPQHGSVSAEQVEDLIRASRRYDELVIAGFSFDGSAQAIIQESENPRLKIHMAHIRPDASPGMDGLLKDSPKSQLFTVFGQPEIEVRAARGRDGGEFEVELLGVDIYSPLTGEITSSGADKVAAWFLDSDYDGRCFCVTQAFFPNQKAWDKIAKGLGSSGDGAALAAFEGTVSVPFESGEHTRIAVKVIDARGNEVMAIRSLEGLG